MGKQRTFDANVAVDIAAQEAIMQRELGCHFRTLLKTTHDGRFDHTVMPADLHVDRNGKPVKKNILRNP